MLNKLPSPKTKKPKIQVGRGVGSGHGQHTAGRGTKGQKSRSGYSRPRPGFEGGQMPLSRRLPRLRGNVRGISREFFRANVQRIVLPLSEVAEIIEDGKVNVESLVNTGLIIPTSKKISAKIVFDQEIEAKLEVSGIAVTKSAKAAIEKAGGVVQE